MSIPRLHIGLGVLVALLAAGAAQRFAKSLHADDNAPVPVISAMHPPKLFRGAELDSAAATAVANDPFRLANAPAKVSFASTINGGPPPAAAARPAFVVRAIIGGPPWRAIIDGIPGQQPGAVVAPGAEFEKIRVRSIGRDTVILQGPDTTWKLTLKRSVP